jgi:glycosyltransferase involved in cell wall biosynthesis
VQVLLIHQNFPGQFRQLAPALLAAGHGVIGIGARQEPWANTGVSYRSCGGDPYQQMRQTNPEMRITAQMAQGRRVSRQLKALRGEGWIPDVVVAHPFWGDVLFLDDVFPTVPLVALLELDFSSLNLNNFDPEQAINHQEDFGANLSLRQWADLMAIKRMTVGLTATNFQRSSYPSWLQNRIKVIHEGVDLDLCKPNPLASYTLPDGTRIRRGDPVVSFGSRSLEPLRGFRAFMRALPALLEANREVIVVIVGEDGSCYGPIAPDGKSWKQLMLEELKDQINLSRIHFTGHLPYAQLLQIFQISQAHVYLTYPYVLSWSMLEAMACGALVVGSATAPVEEIISSGVNGWLVPFFDSKALAKQLLEVLANPPRQEQLRMAARRTVAAKFEKVKCTKQQIALLEAVAVGKLDFNLQ